MPLSSQNRSDNNGEECAEVIAVEAFDQLGEEAMRIAGSTKMGIWGFAHTFRGPHLDSENVTLIGK